MHKRPGHMTTVLITGAKGFIGKNLSLFLGARGDIKMHLYDVDSDESVMEEGIETADFVFHLAGINRSTDPLDFQRGNYDFTKKIVTRLIEARRRSLSPAPVRRPCWTILMATRSERPKKRS